MRDTKTETDDERHKDRDTQTEMNRGILDRERDRQTEMSRERET